MNNIIMINSYKPHFYRDNQAKIRTQPVLIKFESQNYITNCIYSWNQKCYFEILKDMLTKSEVSTLAYH